MSPDFYIGPWLVRPSLNRIESEDAVRHLEPKIMHVLLVLAATPGLVVTKSKIMESVWGDVFVTEDVLTHAIYCLRKALDDPNGRRRMIETIPKGGYRLLAIADRTK